MRDLKRLAMQTCIRFSAFKFTSDHSTRAKNPLPSRLDARCPFPKQLHISNSIISIALIISKFWLSLLAFLQFDADRVCQLELNDWRCVSFTARAPLGRLRSTARSRGTHSGYSRGNAIYLYGNRKPLDSTHRIIVTQITDYSLLQTCKFALDCPDDLPSNGSVSRKSYN